MALRGVFSELSSKILFYVVKSDPFADLLLEENKTMTQVETLLTHRCYIGLFVFLTIIGSKHTCCD